MSVTAALIAFLRSQGMSAEKILEAVEAVELARSDERSAYEVRGPSPRAARNRRYYEAHGDEIKAKRLKASENQTVQSRLNDQPTKENSCTYKKTTSSEAEEASSEAADAAHAQQPVYSDSKHELWGEGIPILQSLGVTERNARSNVGRWLKTAKDDPVSVLSAIQRARDARVIDPIPWITRALTTGPPLAPPQTHKQQRQQGYLDVTERLSQFNRQQSAASGRDGRAALEILPPAGDRGSGDRDRGADRTGGELFPPGDRAGAEHDARAAGEVQILPPTRRDQRNA